MSEPNRSIGINRIEIRNDAVGGGINGGEKRGINSAEWNWGESCFDARLDAVIGGFIDELLLGEALGD